MKITVSQFAEMVRSFDSAVIASFTAETVPSMVVKDRETKAPNPFMGRLVKVARVNGIIGDFSFENVVTNQRLREAEPQTTEEIEAVEEYEAAPRSWGNHIPNSGLVEHHGKLYLRISGPRSLGYQYLISGVPATEAEKEQINRFLSVSKPSARHGTEKEILYRDYTLTNIREFRAGGQIYQIVSDEAEAA